MRANIKRNLSLMICVFMMVALLITGCGKATENKTGNDVIKLKVADIYATTHYVSQGSLQVWMKKVTELTKGKVQFELFPSEQMGKSADMLDVVSQGVADVGYVPYPYFSGRMPLITGAGAISGIWENCTVGNPAVFEVASVNPVLEYDFLRNGVRPVLPFANQVFQVLSNKKPVKTLEDMKGLKIRSSGGVMDKIISSFGAIPVQIPVPELYEALQRGTVDGTLISFVSAQSHKLDEVIKHATRGVNVSGGVFGYVINENTWQKLPKDVQDAMTTASKEALANLAKVMDDSEKQAIESFQKKGIQVYELSAEEQKKWIEAQKPVTDAWIKTMEEKNLPGKTVLESLLSKAQEVRKTAK